MVLLLRGRNQPTLVRLRGQRAHKGFLVQVFDALLRQVVRQRLLLGVSHPPGARQRNEYPLWRVFEENLPLLLLLLLLPGLPGKLRRRGGRLAPRLLFRRLVRRRFLPALARFGGRVAFALIPLCFVEQLQSHVPPSHI